MAVIRTIQAQRGIEVGGIPNTRLDDSIGQGMQSLGGDVAQAGNILHEMNMRQERMKMEMAEFRTDQEFRRFGDDFSLDFAKTQQDIDPSGEGFTDRVSGTFNERAETFLKSVPPALQPKFAELVKTSRETWLNKAAATEIDQRNVWYRDGVLKTQEGLQTQVFNDPAMFDAAKSDGLRAIDASGLPPAEKQKLKEAWEETLSVTIGEREVRDAEADPLNAAGAASRLGVSGAAQTENGGDAMSLLRQEEGFRPTPYWDVNAHRIGYGSDTVTRADGTIVRVTKGMKITRADAERDLARRSKEFEATARGQVGAREWGALHPNAQAALVSVAYNYGSLPASVVGAVKTGNIDGIASSVANLDANKGRRQKEAAIIRGGAIGSNRPDLSGESVDPRYASLSLEKRLEIFDRTMAAAQRGQTAINAQMKASYDSHKGSVELGIQTGEVSSPQTILGDKTLTDAHKADLLSALNTKRGDAMATGEAVRLFAEGSLTVDPYDSKGKKTVDNVWDQVSRAVPHEELQPTLENIVRQTGTVPQAAVNQIRQGITSTNIQDIVQAAQAAQMISAVDPAALGRRDGGSEAQKAADDFSFYVNKLNLSPEDAARRMAEANNPEKKFARKALEPAAKEFVKTMGDLDLANEFSDAWYTSDPSLGFTPGQELGLKAEFLAIAEDQFYAANGDPEIAKNRAVEEMKRLYGVTDLVGRKVVMKHPPERYWPTSVFQGPPKVDIDPSNPGHAIGLLAAPPVLGSSPSHAYVKKQLQADLNALEPGVDLSTVQFVTTPETDAMVKRGEMPGYAVLWKDKNGVLQTLPGKLWRPDATAIQAQDKIRNEAEQAGRVESAQRLDADIKAGRDREQTLDTFLDGPVMPPKPVKRPAQSPVGQINEQRQGLMKDAQDSGIIPRGPK